MTWARATWGTVVACGLLVSATGVWAIHGLLRFGAEAAPKAVLTLRGGPSGAGIWGVWTGHSWAYGIETGPHGLVLVDAGSDPEASAICEQIAARHMTPSDVHAIVITHGHDAVTAGLGVFHQAVVWAGEADRTLVRRDVLPKPWLARLEAKLLRTRRLPKVAVQPLWPGQALPLGQAMAPARIVAVPGYTAGSIALVAQELVFAGASVAVDGPKLRPGVWPKRQSQNPKRNGWALQRLCTEPFDRIVTSKSGLVPFDKASLCAFVASLPPLPMPRAGLPALTLPQGF